MSSYVYRPTSPTGDVGRKHFSYCVCSSNGVLRDAIEVGTTSGESPSDMEMKMWDGLMSGRAVVLPHGDAWTFVSAINGASGISNSDHQIARLPIRKFEQGRNMTSRED